LSVVLLFVIFNNNMIDHNKW